MNKYVILFLVALVIIAISIWPRADYKIVDVESGNIVVLNNGSKVRLIGISDTPEGKEYLEDHYKYAGVDVTLISDSQRAFDPNDLQGNETVYAYVVQNSDAQCINSTMIRLGIVDLEESVYLNDSLTSYRKYQSLTANDK